MKFARYFITPFKVMIYILIIFSIIYFRNAIFVKNINQYVDVVQAYIENRLDVSVPVYVNKNISDSAVYKDDEAKLQAELCDSGVSIDSKSSDSSDSDKVLVSDFNLSSDQVSPNGSVSNEGVVDVKKTVAEIDLLTQLTETVNVLNSKVDKLFDADKASAGDVFKNSDNKEDLVNIDAINSSAEKLTPPAVLNNVGDKDDVYLTENSMRMFNMARQLYWAGDVLGAEAMYLKLAGIESDNPDIYGELGNVYYSHGEWSEAGKAYYEAAIRLLNLGRNNQVNYLLRVIQGLDYDSAEKLKNKMSS